MAEENSIVDVNNNEAAMKLEADNNIEHDKQDECEQTTEHSDVEQHDDSNLSGTSVVTSSTSGVTISPVSDVTAESNDVTSSSQITSPTTTVTSSISTTLPHPPPPPLDVASTSHVQENNATDVKNSNDAQKKCLVQALARVFKRIGDPEESMLHMAARCGNCEMIEAVMEERADDTEEEQEAYINKRNHLGSTALWLAAVAGHANAVKLLCQYEHINLELENIKSQTPVYAAAKMNNVGCLRELLLAGGEPDGNDNNITTPIYVAARENFFEVVELLAEFGADVNGRNRGEEDDGVSQLGKVPIYITLVYQSYESFRVLILNGAKLNSKSNDIGHGSSLVSAIMRYNCDTRYLRLVTMCGGIRSSDHDDVNKVIQTYEELTFGFASHRRECIEYLRKWMRYPLRLSSICRLSIRQCLGQKLSLVKYLGLPLYLQDYIQLNHVVA